MREMYDKQGNSSLVPDNEVQSRLKSGWVFFKKPDVAVCDKCSEEPCECETDTVKNTKIKTKRPKATMRITKAEAEVIKPFNEEDN